jgi:hypothetical protein
MRTAAIAVGVVALWALPAAHAVLRGYASGKIASVQQHTRDRVQLYVVNTPILTEEPYLTIAVEVDGTRYQGEFLPGSRHEIFLGLWKMDESVWVRIEKHFMFLKRADGSEGKFLIVSKSPLHSAQESH